MPDGSWECARALVVELRRRCAPHALRCVHLDAARVAAHTSPLLDALHPGAGRGRLSTLEACANALRILEPTADGERAAACMKSALGAMVDGQLQSAARAR